MVCLKEAFYGFFQFGRFRWGGVGRDGGSAGVCAKGKGMLGRLNAQRVLGSLVG